MNRIVKKVFLLIIVFAILAVPLMIFAEAAPATNTIENPVPWTNLTDLLKSIADFIRSIALLLVAPFIIWGGIIILASGGNPAEVQKGKSIILYAVIGYIVTLLATLGVDVVNQLVQTTPPAGP